MRTLQSDDFIVYPHLQRKISQFNADSARAHIIFKSI